MKKKLFIVSLAFTLIITALIYRNRLFGEEFKTIIDLDDNKIEVPADPQRIACLHGPTYDRILMLGKAKSIALMPMKASPWALKLFPEIKNTAIITSYLEADIEQMFKYKIDLVFYSLYHSHGEKLKKVGIRAACPFSEKKLPESMNDYKENYKRQISFFGEILGAEAKIRAGKYCEYFDNIINRIISITSVIPESKKPKIYYGGLNRNLYDTQGKNTVMYWCVKAAGGNFITEDLNTHFGKITVEQLMEWDPEFIFIGMRGSLDNVINNQVLKGIKAVKNNNVFMIPVGTFWWDLASGETALLPLFIAKKIHPDLMKEWDIIQEMKIFYEKIYDKKISSRDAERILEALPPDKDV